MRHTAPDEETWHLRAAHQLVEEQVAGAEVQSATRKVHKAEPPGHRERRDDRIRVLEQEIVVQLSLVDGLRNHCHAPPVGIVEFGCDEADTLSRPGADIGRVDAILPGDRPFHPERAIMRKGGYGLRRISALGHIDKM